MNRPGAALLGSLIRSELLGRPGPAREASLAAAENGPPEDVAVHLIDAACAAVASGEPRRAKSILARIEADADPLIARKREVCEAWIVWLDENWFPGDICSFNRETIAKGVREIQAVSRDQETRELEACVAFGPVPLLSVRGLLEQIITQSQQAAQQLLQRHAKDLEAFDTATAGRYRQWAWCNFADLLRRAGKIDAAESMLNRARELCVATGDRKGLARAFLCKCDWNLTPGATPESLGWFYSGASSLTDANPEAAERELEEAESLIREAGVTERIEAAIALRHAVLAWQKGDFASQQRCLRKAHRLCEAAGDMAGVMVCEVHDLIRTVADGDVAMLREIAGAGWGLSPRPRVAAIWEWAQSHGSVSFCTGLGRLLEMAGSDWREKDHTRAQALYLMAYTLVRSADERAAVRILAVLGDMDVKRHQNVCALIRYEQCLKLLPKVATLEDKVAWTRQLELAISITGAQTSALGASYGNEGLLRGLDRSVQRLRELVAKGLELGGGSQMGSPFGMEGALAKLASMGIERPLSDYTAISESKVTELFQLGMQMARHYLIDFQGQAMLHRARLASRAGLPSEELFSQAAAISQGQFMEVLILSLAGRSQEAIERLNDVRQRGELPASNLALLALRTRQFELARELFPPAPESGGDWRDLANRAEVALECGSHQEALELAKRALAIFESEASGFLRDPERIAAFDDIVAAGLYQVAARAAMLNADEELSFLWTERSRQQAFVRRDPTSLSLEVLAWRRMSAEWSAAFDQLLAAFDRDQDPGDAFSKLEQLELGLSLLEDALPPQDKIAPSVTLADLRRLLPEHALLLEYLIVGRDLSIWCVKKDAVRFHYQHLEKPPEEWISQFIRKCAEGDPTPDAQELEKVLLDPFTEEIRGTKRLVLVPFGPLYALPMHALPFDGRPLSEGRIVSSVPSASFLAERELDRPLPQGSWIAVGDPAFDSEVYPRLRRLPGAAVEAAALLNLKADTLLLTDRDAHGAALRTALSKPCALLHLAAHGLLDQTAPAMSSIILAGNDQLTVADLSGLHLQADLVILSACDTGRGAVTMGGELVGLARALLTAGASRCVVALWPVDDFPACVLMHEFHRHLASGEVSPSLALSMAQSAIRLMSQTDLAKAYRSLGGAEASANRSLRRGGASLNSCQRTERLLKLDPEFAEKSAPEKSVTLDGSLPRIWGSFVMVGC